MGDPRLGGVGLFLSLGRVLPDRYPATEPITTYLRAENPLSRLLDYGVIVQRIAPLYNWSARTLAQPGLADLVQQDALIYALSYAERWIWHPDRLPWPARVQRRALPPKVGW